MVEVADGSGEKWNYFRMKNVKCVIPLPNQKKTQLIDKVEEKD